MHNEYKRQSPYRGFWITLLLLIVPPLVCFGIVDSVLDSFSKWPDDLDAATAKALGCWLGFLVHMICLLSGLLTPGWEALKYRVADFFENLIVGVGYAIKSYWENIVADGVTFLICFSIILTNFLIMVDGVRDALALLM